MTKEILSPSELTKNNSIKEEEKKSPEIASISIKNLIGKSSDSSIETGKVKFTSTPEEHNTLEDKEVVYDNLKLQWKAFSQNIEKQNPRLFSILINSTPELNDDKSIVVKVETTSQEAELRKNRAKLLKFLQQKLSNRTIQIEVVVEKSESTEPPRAYTASDKLSAMMKKNPALFTLKEKFNLDIS